jgi:hypothetical protein
LINILGKGLVKVPLLKEDEAKASSQHVIKVA